MDTVKFKLTQAHTINGVAYNEGDLLELDARTATAYEGAGIGSVVKDEVEAKKEAPKKVAEPK